MPKMLKLHHFSADFIHRYKYFTPMEFQTKKYPSYLLGLAEKVRPRSGIAR